MRHPVYIIEYLHNYYQTVNYIFFYYVVLKL